MPWSSRFVSPPGPRRRAASRFHVSQRGLRMISVASRFDYFEDVSSQASRAGGRCRRQLALPWGALARGLLSPGYATNRESTSALGHNGRRILPDRILADRVLPNRILADRGLADRGLRRRWRRLAARQVRRNGGAKHGQGRSCYE